MNLILWSLGWLFFLHWIGDFVAQSDRMAIGKSKSVGWLTLHCLIYAVCLLLVPIHEIYLWNYSLSSFPSLALAHNSYAWPIPRDWYHHIQDLKYTTPWEFVGLITTIWFTLVFITHWITDFYTSKATAWLYPRSRHYFFVMIGFDQLIHILTLLILYWYIIW